MTAAGTPPPVPALAPERPLFGHRSGKKAQTHWVAFIKEAPHA